MNNEELNVSVGDKVLYYWSRFGQKIEVITEVIKVTPTGRIRVAYNKDIQFNKFGQEMGGDTWSSHTSISIPTEKDYKRIKENNERIKVKKLLAKLDFESLSYENAVRLSQLLSEINQKE